MLEPEFGLNETADVAIVMLQITALIYRSGY